MNLNQFLRYTGGSLGFISQADGDTGDSCNRLGVLYSLLFFAGYERDHLQRDLKEGLLIESEKICHGVGVYSRSPYKDHWGFKIDNLSRDQKEMLQLAFATNGLKSQLKSSILKTILNFGFHQNTRRGTDDPKNRWKMPDIMAPRELACAIRGLDLWYLSPALYLIDIFLIISVLTRKSDEWDQDPKLSINLMYSVIKYPTTLSKFALKKYLMTNHLERLYNYFKEEDGNNGILPLYYLYVEALSKVGAK